MIENYDIAGYTRISVDDELDRDNTSIENQKAIIEDFVKHKFPGSSLTFYEDRDRSGYTFDQREGYQAMRRELMSHRKDILIVKDFSRFSRRNSRGLVELEDLRDAGVRIISIGDGIDFPGEDEWMKIQFQFLINEMPVTDASRKVKSVIRRRQEEGNWICAAPYGYIINEKKQFEICPSEAEVVRKIFSLYNEGRGYKKIANTLTDMGIPTPRMAEKNRKEAKGAQTKRAVRSTWSIITIQGILDNDFYIGTLRQGKYTRSKINGKDIKKDDMEHIVIEKHHQAIIDYRTFAITRENRKMRTNTNYRGVKKYDNVYSGFLVCGDCGSPMFSMSRPDIAAAYVCSSYHRRGIKGCTSHHIRVDVLDDVVKAYIKKVMANSGAMLEQLNEDLHKEDEDISRTETAEKNLSLLLPELRDELKATKRQRIRDIMKHPEQEDTIEAAYEELEADLTGRIEGIQKQIELTFDKRNAIIRVNRAAKTVMEIFDDILKKPKLDKNDLEFIISEIRVYENRIEVRLKSNIDSLISCGELPESAANFNRDIMDNLSVQVVQSAKKRADKVYDVNVISNGDPLEIFTNRDGEVIFKKYSAMEGMAQKVQVFADSLARATGRPAAVCDRDTVLAVAGLPKKDYADKGVSEPLGELMQRRVSYVRRVSDLTHLPLTGTQGASLSAVTPVVSESDCVGAVVLLSPDNGAVADEQDVRQCTLLASVLSGQMGM